MGVSCGTFNTFFKRDGLTISMEITDGTRTLGVASEEVEECHPEAADKEGGQNFSFYQKLFLPKHNGFFVQNRNVHSMKSLKKLRT